MAVNIGKDGYVNLAGKKMLNINNWELNITEDALETTCFSSATPWDRTYVPGLRGVTATFSGYYEDTSTGQYTAVGYLLNTGTPTTVAAQLLYSHPTTATYNGYGGGAVITGITLGAAVDGIQTISGTLTFDGGIHTTAKSS
jgi:hypothetical protein